MRHIVSSLAMLLSAWALPVSAHAAAPEKAAEAATRALPPATPARTALAGELVGYTQPKALLLEAVLVGWNKGIAEQQAAADLAELDRIESGLSAKFLDRGQAEIVALVSERIPEMHRRLAGVYADNCTEEELKALIAFYSSPLGTKLIRSMTLSVTGADSFDDEKFTAEEATQANREAARDAVKSLSGDEWIEAVKFGVSPSGRLVKSLAPKVQAISAEWMTKLMADFGTRMEPIAEEMVMQALEQADKQGAAD